MSSSRIAEALPERFAVERVLGRGAAATTYLAFDQLLQRQVVIKALNRSWTGDPHAAARFAREARVAAAISHPNVVGVYDFGEHAGVDYLVLRYVEGATLREHLAARGPLPAAEAVRLVGQILAGLGAIHAAGLVHRDVKPENIIVGADGLLRITDFGIAVALADPRLTTSGEIWGTPAYMAPEQVLGRPVTAAADLYAAGIILFEALAGRLPFPGNESAAVALAQVSMTSPAPREVNPATDAPSALEAVLRRALAKDPAERPASAAAMAKALADALQAPTRQLRPPRAPATALPGAIQRNDQPTLPLPTPASRQVRRSGRLAAALALLGALVLGTAIAIASGHRPGGLWGGRGAPAPTLTAAASGAQSAHVIPTPTTTAPSVTPTRAPTVSTETPAPTSTPDAAVTSIVAEIVATMPPAPTETQTPTIVAIATDAPKPTGADASGNSSSSDAGIVPGGPTIAPAETNGLAPTEPPADAGAAGGDGQTAGSAIQFGADAWRGGYRGDQRWYGRPWIALYGAKSQYPRATLTFTLAAAPARDLTITLEGLDDESPGNVSVTITVNGAAVFSGPSPWQSWDGAGNGENAAWTSVAIVVPAAVLHAGANQLVVANTEPAANFGVAPYVLLSGGSIETAP